jgi:hypothetical protein
VLEDGVPFDAPGTILEPTDPNGIRRNKLVFPPRDRVWVGLRHPTGTKTIIEVRADGSVEKRSTRQDFSPIGRFGPQVGAGGERVVAAETLERILSCSMTSPSSCVDVPIGGTFVSAPDGTWAAGPAVVGPRIWMSPSRRQFDERDDDGNDDGWVEARGDRTARSPASPSGAEPPHCKPRAFDEDGAWNPPGRRCENGRPTS